MPTRGRPKRISSEPNTTKLFVDDRRELFLLASNEKKSMSVVIRELVHEALRERRLRALGRHEKEDFVRNLQRETIVDAIQPLTTEIATLRQLIEVMPPPAIAEPEAITHLSSMPERAMLTLIRIQLGRAIIAENLCRILVTVGMQNDKINSEEIQKLLRTQDQTGHRLAEATMRKILARFGLSEWIDAGGEER